MWRGESEVRCLSEPSVCAILLTADRPEYARRAVAAFRAQTYQAKRLLVFDTGKRPLHDLDIGDGDAPEWYAERGKLDGFQTVGTLRNLAASFPMANTSDILIHFDDDDFSHANRIAEQVALLRSSGADVVGYNEMLFWREADACSTIERRDSTSIARGQSYGEAWLYSNPDPRYCLGTSLCYWRKTWERKPFEATSQGEDIRFCTGLKCVGVRGIGSPIVAEDHPPDQDTPRMIARIHAGNTSTVYRPELMAAIERQGGEWKRVPEWDSYCRGVCERTKRQAG